MSWCSLKNRHSWRRSLPLTKDTTKNGFLPSMLLFTGVHTMARGSPKARKARAKGKASPTCPSPSAAPLGPTAPEVLVGQGGSPLAGTAQPCPEPSEGPVSAKVSSLLPPTLMFNIMQPIGKFWVMPICVRLQTRVCFWTGLRVLILKTPCLSLGPSGGSLELTGYPLQWLPLCMIGWSRVS